ncbi:unnamed protein product [Gulo gulo]|uniref:Uncharacterized protein n=1 Tax=Gulo gulo TaxID=48420 RepID=A0A9X9PVR0_GULGU|nr:unnamed protein product [Gulo gulo]
MCEDSRCGVRARETGPKCCPGHVALAVMEVFSGPLRAQGDVEAEMQTWASPSSRPASPRSSCRRPSCRAELSSRRRRGEDSSVFLKVW